VALTARTLAALAVVGLLAWAVPAARADNLGDGNTAFDAGRYADARQLWLAAARAGDAQAAFNLGLLYDLGDGVAPSAATAIHWYKRAAEAGLGAAAFNVGVMYDSGRGVPLDRAKAAIWYARAAALGQPRAAFNLGQLYEYGDGVAKNIDAAEVWYGVAAVTIPEAAVKASALAAEHPRAVTGALVPPRPAWPATGSTVSVSGPHPPIQLVWTAPLEPHPVTWFVELQARENGRYSEVAASYVTTTAVAVTLPDAERFAWRVYAVAADGSAYAAGPWSLFEKRPPARDAAMR
jgi:hypothetical protein